MDRFKTLSADLRTVIDTEKDADMLVTAYISDYLQVAMCCFLYLSQAISSPQEGFTQRSPGTRDQVWQGAHTSSLQNFPGSNNTNQMQVPRNNVTLWYQYCTKLFYYTLLKEHYKSIGLPVMQRTTPFVRANANNVFKVMNLRHLIIRP